MFNGHIFLQLGREVEQRIWSPTPTQAYWLRNTAFTLWIFTCENGMTHEMESDITLSQSPCGGACVSQ